MTKETAANRVLDFLYQNKPFTYSKPAIARTLMLPADSVRRVVNTLVKKGRLVRVDERTFTVPA